MSVPALATVDGLRSRGVDCADAARARAAIEDASALIHHETGNRWIIDGELDPDMPAVVTTVAYKVIRRALTNPDDIEGETLGPFQQTRRRTDGDVYLFDSEKELLHGTTGTVRGLSTVKMAAPWPTYRRDNPVGYYEPDAEATGS